VPGPKLITTERVSNRLTEESTAHYTLLISIVKGVTLSNGVAAVISLAHHAETSHVAPVTWFMLDTTFVATLLTYWATMTGVALLFRPIVLFDVVLPVGVGLMEFAQFEVLKPESVEDAPAACGELLRRCGMGRLFLTSQRCERAKGEPGRGSRFAARDCEGCHPTGEGKLDLCAAKDACSNRIVGYSIDARMTGALAVAGLHNAVALRGTVGTVVRSDRAASSAPTPTTERYEQPCCAARLTGSEPALTTRQWSTSSGCYRKPSSTGNAGPAASSCG
jgi:hypothetical protein